MNTFNNGQTNLAFNNGNALNTNNISWLLSSQQSGTEKAKEKEKAKKKLAQFLDQSIDNLKRFKGLISYINNSDDQDIDKVFKDNSYQIYQILLTTFSTYELGSYKAGKHHYAEKEVYKVNELLKRILIHLEGVVKKGWQVKSIVNILEKMLGVENIHSIRLASFSTLLFFLEVMEKPDRHKLELFASIVDYTPFTPDYTYRIQFARRVFSGHESKRFIVIQATEPPSRDDSCRLFEQLFVHISSRLNNFSFWFELLKSNYLTVIYPSICKKLGVLAPNDNTGFGSHCPHELQVIVINYVCTWITSNSTIRDYLLSNLPLPPIPVAPATNSTTTNSTPATTATGAPSTTTSSSTANGTITLSVSNEQLTSTASASTASSASATSSPTSNSVTSQLTTSTPGVGRVAILLEIFKQSCKLPLKYVEIIKKSIFTFQNLFFSPNAYEMESIVGADYFVFQKFILNEMMNVFETDASGYEKERDSIGQVVIGVFKNLIDQYGSLRPQTREILLNATLQATTTLLRRANPNKSVSSTLEQSMLSTTLYAWIKSKELSSDMWARFNQHFEELYFRVEVIKQIKAKILQITCMLRDIVYPLTEKKLAKIEKDKKNAEKGGSPKSPDTLETLPEIHIDSALSQIEWDRNSLSTTWYFLLAMLNNLNQIKDPLIHELATDILVDVIDIILAAEDIVEFSTTQKQLWKPLSLFNLFGKRLFETHDLDSKFTKSKVLAITGLCRLVCRHHLQYPNDILSAFYHYIGLNLNGPVTPGQTDLGCTAILHSSPIFSLATPGSNILVTSYLHKIRSIFTALKQEQSVPPTDVRKKSLFIVSSLLFYPNHFPVLILPGFKDSTNKLTKDLTMKELKRELVDILTMALRSEKLTENRLVCIWSLSTMIMEEFSNSNDLQQELVDEILNTLLQFTLHQEASISKTSLDAIATISLIFSRLPKEFINTIIVSLCKSIHKGYQEIEIGNTTITETIVANHFYCLLDWVCLDNSIFDDPIYQEFRMVLFSAIELGLGQRGEMWSSTYEGGRCEDSKDHLKNLSKTLTKKQATNLNKSGSGAAGGVKGKVDIDDDALETFGVASKPNPIRESAETLLSHCLNFVHNFPAKHGPEIITSMIEENDDIATLSEDEMPLFSVFNENALISVVEVPKQAPEQGTLARLFIRDATGKYVWSFDHQYNPLASLSSTESDCLPRSLLSHYLDQKAIVIDNQNYQYVNQTQQQTIAPLPVDDKLKNLLSSLSTNYPEVINGASLEQPLNNLKPTLVTEFERIQEEVANFVKQEKSYHSENYNKSVAPSWDGVPPSKIPGVASQSRRLLMSYLGLLNIGNAPHFKQLENSLKLGRALQQLDITPSREILKIGLIYVSEGQDDQRDILHNNGNSSMFSEFVDGIGWPVDLQTHQGYMGGLDRKRTTGITAPYFANTTIEAIFHNISGMPTNKADLQQIHKKRHVGNDIVNIIWSEHVRDYSATTITSQFNDAHIVIYPLPNGLFRVQIYRKESKVPLFGPLIHGMTVNKKLLSTLVRQTAINAYRYIRTSTPNYTRPYALRKLRIKEIVDRYNDDRSYVDFVHSIVSGYTPVTPPATSTDNTNNSNNSGNSNNNIANANNTVSST